MQSDVTAPVVKVSPTNDPPHASEVADAEWYPVSGVKVQVVVAPSFTGEAQLIPPLPVDDPLTLCCITYVSVLTVSELSALSIEKNLRSVEVEIEIGPAV